MSPDDADLAARKEAEKRAELAEEEARLAPGTATTEASQQDSDQTWG
jgi:hypothetical protein